MEASTTIGKMLKESKILVPIYQRAYSWETPSKNNHRETHTDVFLADLEEYEKSNVTTPYYFGHFLFEEKENYFYVIDGQQRLTTIIIFLSALFAKLKKIRKLKDEEDIWFEDMVKYHNIFRFSTVDYDNQLFVDYVIEQTKRNKFGIDTDSAKRIVAAFDYFTQHLVNKDEKYLIKMIINISKSSCTTHPVRNESEAIQMFIFQNNRGKDPSNLEIIKAQFMYIVHLHGGKEKDNLISEIKNRFEKIYKSISSIEYKIDEDDVLVYTLRVHFNSLDEGNAPEKINKQLSEDNPIPFIKAFTQSLAASFEHLSSFLGKDERENFAIHSLVTLGGLAMAFPFIIKAYKLGLQINKIGELCASLESLVLRHRLIGTRADMTSRINKVFIGFTEDNREIEPIIQQINYLKTATDWWWAFWNNEELEKSIQGWIYPSTAKYLLWKYEIYLKSQEKAGYVPARYDTIINPHLEHIAPQTEPEQLPHGYGKYDEEFRNQYLNCLGNYLLLSETHNCSIGNIPFIEKHKTYKHLLQQQEIQKLVPENGVWNKKAIQERKERLIRFVIDNY